MEGRDYNLPPCNYVTCDRNGTLRSASDRWWCEDHLPDEDKAYRRAYQEGLAAGRAEVQKRIDEAREPAKCENCGMTDYWRCAECGHELSTQEDRTP